MIRPEFKHFSKGNRFKIFKAIAGDHKDDPRAAVRILAGVSLTRLARELDWLPGPFTVNLTRGHGPKALAMRRKVEEYLGLPDGCIETLNIPNHRGFKPK